MIKRLQMPGKTGAAFRQPYYIRLILSFIVLSLVIIIISISIQFSYYYRTKQTEIDAFYLSALEQAGTFTDIMYEQVILINNSMVSDPVIANYLNKPDTDIIDEYIAFLALKRYQSLHPYVYSIFVYKNERLLSGSYGSTLSGNTAVIDMLVHANMRSSESFSVISLPEIQNIHTGTNFISSPSFFFYPYTGTIADTAIVICIDDRYILDIIGTISAIEDSGILVLDAENSVIAQSENVVPERYRNEIGRIGALSESSGRFTSAIDGQRLAFTYSKSDMMGWQFICIRDYESDFAPIRTFFTVLLVIAAGLFLLAVIISFFTANNLYKPLGSLMLKLGLMPQKSSGNEYQAIDNVITRMADDNEMMSKQLETTLPILEEYQIHEILNGMVADIPEEYESLLSMNHCVIAWKVDGNPGNIAICKYFISNMLSEYMSEYGKIIQTQHDHQVSLMMLSSKELIAPDLITNKLLALRSRLHQLYEQTFTCAIGHSVSSLSEAHSSKEHALNLLKNSFVLGYNQIITQSYADTVLSSQYALSAGFNDKVINIMKTVKLPEMELSQLFTYLSDKPYEACVFEIQNFLRDIAIEFGNECINKFGLNDLSGYENLAFLKTAVLELCEYIVQTEADKADQKSSVTINRVKEYINGNFRDPDLTLYKISESVGYSTGYIRKKFKAAEGISLADYINNVRLESAKEMLIKTDKPSVAIGSDVGFNSGTYFTTIFKKHVGMTPIMYRENFKK